MGSYRGSDQSQRETGLQPVSSAISTGSTTSMNNKPVSILNNGYKTNERRNNSVERQQTATSTCSQNGGQKQSNNESDPSSRPRVDSPDSSDSIYKYPSSNRYNGQSNHSSGYNSSEQNLKIVTDSLERSPQKTHSGLSSLTPASASTAVSFTVPNPAKAPHHRYSINAKPGRSSITNSPNTSSEQLFTKESPSEEKNSIVHMPGDFIYFEPKSKNVSRSGSVASTSTTGTSANILPKREVIRPFTGPQVPFTEFFQKEDDKKFHILIGATGSVATIKVPLIIDKLFKIYTPEKVSIQLIVTKPGEHFLKGLKISTNVKIWREEDAWFGFKKMGDPVLHHEMRKWADIFLIAPLSANTLAKLANGICDNLLTSVLRDWTPSTPVLVAPAMNTFMYINPMTKTHLKILQEDTPYITVLKPVEKVLICGDIGMGGMREWNDIVDILRRKITEIRKAREEDEEDEDEEDDDEDDEEDEEDEDEADGHNGVDEEEDDDDDEDEDDDDEEDEEEDDVEEEENSHKQTSLPT